jgi:hypothetical protein
MQAAFFSLFQVRDVVEGVGIRVTDLLRDQEHFLADVGFSQSAVEGIVLAARVLPFEGFIMTTGAALPVETDVLEWVAGSVGRSGMSAESMRELPPEVWAQVEAKVVRACLHSEGNQRTTYEDVPGGVPAATLSKDPAHVGRNAPCPCGSGKKYKKCCGRR